jgi:hypothetical protein
MLFLDDDIYLETKKIALGESEKGPMLKELSDWFMNTYTVKVLNIQFSYLIHAKRFRLLVIIENSKDFQKMYVGFLVPKEGYQAQIELEFRELVQKYKFTDETKLENLFVIFDDFEEEAKTDANWKASKEVETFLKSKYPVVWYVNTEFSGSVVFYYSDADIMVNETNGISSMITNDYYPILKKYDDLNYFTRDNISLKFDSKENVDKNFEGNMFYYSKR